MNKLSALVDEKLKNLHDEIMEIGNIAIQLENNMGKFKPVPAPQIESEALQFHPKKGISLSLQGKVLLAACFQYPYDNHFKHSRVAVAATISVDQIQMKILAMKNVAVIAVGSLGPDARYDSF